MHYTIYKVTNKINGKVYIGSHKTKNLDDGYMGSGKYLKRAIEKNGIENFEKEILFVYDNPEAMYQKEGEIVNEDFLATENTYNLKVGGYGGFDYINSNKLNVYENAGKIGYGGENLLKGRYRIPSEKEKIKRAKTLKERYALGDIIPPFLNKNHTEETKKKISEKNKVSLKGEKNSQYGTMWITDGIVNKKIKIEQDIPVGWNKGRK
jgi:group I intron endonuclease